MTQQPVARLGDTSDHGGSIISASSTFKCDNIFVARVGDLHLCPIPGHGVTALTNGSTNFRDNSGKIVAVIGSVAGCGAKINTGSPTTKAPFDGEAPPPPYEEPGFQLDGDDALDVAEPGGIT